jgi:hypothetical protein
VLVKNRVGIPEISVIEVKMRALTRQ